jgi:Tol biopolymer transport system component
MQRRGETRGSALWISAPEGPAKPLLDDEQWFHMKPFFARDGQRVFFSRRPARGGPRNVMSVSLDGKELRSHSSLPDADDHSARASPSRDEIIFVSDRDGPPAVYLAELPDGAARRLSPRDSEAFAPRWSPDGELVVASHTKAGAPPPRLNDPDSLAATRVFVLDRKGRVLLDAPGMMPDWMPEWP